MVTSFRKKDYRFFGLPGVLYETEVLLSMKKSLLIMVVLCWLSLSLYAGDRAEFVNLGFSSDGSLFMYGQYGINNLNDGMFADLQVMELPTNTLRSDLGQYRLYRRMIYPEQTGREALYESLEEYAVDKGSLVTIDHLSTGRLLYKQIPGEKTDEGIMFRDFSNGVDYSVAVTQRSVGEGSEIKSSLVLSVYRDTDTGEDKRYSVGMMTGYMLGRSGFQIKQVMLSPDSRFLLIVVQYEQYEEDGNDVRYMVRAVEL